MKEPFRRRYHCFGLKQPHESRRLEAINIAAARKFCTALKPSGVSFRTTSRLLHSSPRREDQTTASESCGTARRVDKNYPPPRNLHKYVVRRDFPVGEVDRNAIYSSSEIDAVGIREDFEEEDVAGPAATKEPAVGSKGMRNSYLGTGSSDRKKVLETLNLFQEKYTALLTEWKSKQTSARPSIRKLPVKAAAFLKDQGRWINSIRRIGDIPGIDKGDSFQFRAELSIIGVHIPYQHGIDYFEQEGIVLATSIVDNGCYNNRRKSSDILIYSGEGGKPRNRCHEREDQKLEHGNLALKNSCIFRKPVRVISYKKVLKLRKSLGTTPASNRNVYVYDGLYLVNKYWQSQGNSGNIVFNFELQRMSGNLNNNLMVIKSH